MTTTTTTRLSPLSVVVVLGVVLALAAAPAPVEAQWGEAFPSFPSVADVNAAVSSYWQSVLGGLGYGYQPPAAPGGHDGGGAHSGAPLPGVHLDLGVDEAAPAPVAGPDPVLVEQARLHVIEMLLNLTMDTYSEIAGVDAQAVAYDYEDEDDEIESEGDEGALNATDILSTLYDKILNISSTKEGSLERLVNYSETERPTARNLTDDTIRIVRAIETLPRELREVIIALNESLQTEGRAEKKRRPLRQAKVVASDEEGAMAPEVRGRVQRDPPRSSTVRDNSSASGSAGAGLGDDQCVLRSIIEDQSSCLGIGLRNQDEVCLVSIIGEALRQSQDIRETLDESTFSVLFMPSDSAILKMLKFAGVSPRLALKGQRMQEVIKRHSVVYQSKEYSENPFEKIGIGKLLDTDVGSRFVLMELPSGIHRNAPNVTLMMDRKENGTSSLYIATKKPGCLMQEYNMEGTIARFYTVVEEKCMTDYLQFCMDPTFESNLPGIVLPDSVVTENPCGIAQLLGVNVCKDGIILPINDLLFDSDQTSNFIALLTGATQTGQADAGDATPAYDWPLVDAPPLYNNGTKGNVTAKVIGKYSKKDFSRNGMTMNGRNFLYVPRLDLNETNRGGTTICLSVEPNTTKLYSALLTGLSDKWNFTVTARTEHNLRRLRFQTGPVGYTSPLVLQDKVENNIAIVIDDENGFWLFYENGWLVNRKDGMPRLPNFVGEMIIGGSSSFTAQDANWEGSIGNIKLFEKALSPEEIARFCQGSQDQRIFEGQPGARATKEATEAQRDLNDRLTARLGPGDLVAEQETSFGPIAQPSPEEGAKACVDRILQHLKFVSPAPKVPAGTTAGMLDRGQAEFEEFEKVPQYFYRLTTNGSNTGAYGPSSYATPYGMQNVSFTPNGVHFDGVKEFLLLSDIALTGGNLSLGFTFSFDSYERVHQTMFQVSLLSLCLVIFLRLRCR